MRALSIFCCLLLISCAEKKPVEIPPSDLITEETMVKVLAEVHLLQAALQLRSPLPKPRPQPHLPGITGTNDPSIADVKQPSSDSLGYYNIFTQYDVTKKQYISSMKWYCKDPERMNEIYDKVIVELTQRQIKAQTGVK